MSALRLPFRRPRPPDPLPDAPFRAVGDLHGRADLLDRVLAEAGAPLVLLGDYVDRGPDSAGVLRRLMALTEKTDIVCLMGNHEEMLLDFLADPVAGARWLRHGGAETLASFGIAAPPDGADPVPARDALARAMGPAMRGWLAALPSIWRSGNVACVHAAADPGRAIDDQDDAVLRWGHRDFGRRPRADGLWVLHGHVVVQEPRIRAGTIAIDTGAWATDRLTLAHLGPDGATFGTVGTG